jgi:glycosyltransferase involved in cell wall biosynthesis
VPVPVEPSGRSAERDIAAITYGAHPEKKGLDRVLAAWAATRHEGEELVVAGLDPERGERFARSARAGAAAGAGAPLAGVRFAGALPRAEYRALLRRARVFVTAPRREDHGIAQLEALADGCALVTAPSPGPYAALPIARELDPRLVTDDLATALRAALDEPAPGYAERAAEALRPYAHAEVDRVVADLLLPRLLN